VSGDAWGGAWGNCWGGTWGEDAAPDTAAPVISGPDAPRRRTDRTGYTNDELFDIAVAIILSGCLDG
jgi:hypothetical protein